MEILKIPHWPIHSSACMGAKHSRLKSSQAVQGLQLVKSWSRLTRDYAFSSRYSLIIKRKPSFSRTDFTDRSLPLPPTVPNSFWPSFSQIVLTIRLVKDIRKGIHPPGHLQTLQKQSPTQMDGIYSVWQLSAGIVDLFPAQVPRAYRYFFRSYFDHSALTELKWSY